MHCWFYRPQRPFRFEEMWTKDERCKGVVHAAWDLCLVGDPMRQVLQNISNFQTQLKSWNKNVFGHIKGSLTRKRKLLAKAESKAISGQGISHVKALREEINKLMDLEECM